MKFDCVMISFLNIPTFVESKLEACRQLAEGYFVQYELMWNTAKPIVFLA